MGQELNLNEVFYSVSFETRGGGVDTQRSVVMSV